MQAHCMGHGHLDDPVIRILSLSHAPCGLYSIAWHAICMDYSYSITAVPIDEVDECCYIGPALPAHTWQ